MKRFAVPLLVTLTIALAAAAFVQTRQVQTKTIEAAQLRDEAQKVITQLCESEQKIASLEEKTKILNAESAALREKLQAVAQPVAATVPEPSATPASGDGGSKNGMGDFFKKMLKDPAMKKMMATQQTAALRNLYSDFAKSSHLTPEQADKLFDILGQRQMSMMDKAGDLMNGSQVGDDTKNAMADQTKAFDAQVKDLLGDDGAKQFHSYEKSIGDHMAMQQFSQQLSATGTPLSSDQSAGLLQVMTDERAKQPIAPPKQEAMMAMSDDQMQQYFQQQQDLNARVSARAMSLLTADQMQTFTKFQQQQIDLQKMGMNMARQMFGGKK